MIELMLNCGMNKSVNISSTIMNISQFECAAYNVLIDIQNAPMFCIVLPTVLTEYGHALEIENSIDKFEIILKQNGGTY